MTPGTRSLTRTCAGWPGRSPTTSTAPIHVSPEGRCAHAAESELLSLAGRSFLRDTSGVNTIARELPQAAETNAHMPPQVTNATLNGAPPEDALKEAQAQAEMDFER